MKTNSVAVMISAELLADPPALAGFLKGEFEKGYACIELQLLPNGGIWKDGEPAIPYIEIHPENDDAFAGTVEGEWYWVRTEDGAEFPAIRRKAAAGGWSNDDTWEDFDRQVKWAKPILARNTETQ